MEVNKMGVETKQKIKKALREFLLPPPLKLKYAFQWFIIIGGVVTLLRDILHTI